MEAAIATVIEINGSVSAIGTSGHKRGLSLGDSLSLDEVVKTGADSLIQLEIGDGNSLRLESLQSIKLSADVSADYMSDQVDAVLNADLPVGLVEQLFSVYPLGVSSILTDIEPVYDIERIKLTEYQEVESSLNLSDILQNSSNNNSLDQYLRFDQLATNTVIYFSNDGSFSNAASVELNADKVLTINSVGYNNSAELLSFLIDNYLIVDQV
ncbi:MAG: type I secretion C-terminal target domain-containing protein [Oceanospirillaceae bacterium]|nr:type I secretion C-terminal target domain-containing protein [Oceanospirillaceae bacterium]